MMPSSSNKVVHQNHDAVASLLKGDYERSLACSWEALGMIQTILMAPHQPRFQEQQQESPATMAAAAVNAPVHQQTRTAAIRSIPLLQLPCSLQGGADAGAGAGALALFNRALVLEAESAGDQDVTLAGVLLYNAGLCHHVQGLLNPADSTRQFSAALQLYSKATSLLFSDTQDAMVTMMDDDDDEDDDYHDGKSIREANVLLLQLALLNNTAHIHSSYLVDVEKAWDCVDAMNDLFKILSLMEDEEEEQTIVASDDFYFFSMVCTLVNEDSFVRAPAA